MKHVGTFSNPNDYRQGVIWFSKKAHVYVVSTFDAKKTPHAAFGYDLEHDQGLALLRAVKHAAEGAGLPLTELLASLVVEDL